MRDSEFRICLLSWLSLNVLTELGCELLCIFSVGGSCLEKMRRKFEILGHLVICCSKDGRILFWEDHDSALFITCWVLIAPSSFSIRIHSGTSSQSLGLETFESSWISLFYHLPWPIALSQNLSYEMYPWVTCTFPSFLFPSDIKTTSSHAWIDSIAERGGVKSYFYLLPHILKYSVFKTGFSQLYLLIILRRKEKISEWPHSMFLLIGLYLLHPQGLLGHKFIS